MRSSAAKIKLTSVDDLFSSEESRADVSRERVVEIPLAEMHPFKNHPFKVLDDEKMQDIPRSDYWRFHVIHSTGALHEHANA